MHASNLRVMCKSNDRSRQRDFGVRERDRISQRSKIRNCVVRRIKTVNRNLAKIGNRSLSPRISLSVGEPQRRIIAASIERVDAYLFLCATDDAIESSASEIVQLFDDWSIGIDRSALYWAARLYGLVVRGRRHL